jgi:hypothetical protein
MTFYAGVAVERCELVQEGVAGPLVAERRYDPGLDTPFPVYASFGCARRCRSSSPS